MKTSNLLISTRKEAPNDAQIISHKLMLRAGFIDKVASGLYSYLPIGLRVLQKIEKIVRQEMNKSGAQEILMPIMQPAELWQQSGRWDEYGVELFRFQDRHDRDFCLGPTHEEVVATIAKNYIRSYKQLPCNFYQIQTKFRDEIRPRFGVMRSREFIMKDAYSFHVGDESLKQEYEAMRQTYCNIFDRLELEYRCVVADSGTIGGDNSHEFHVLADSGEDEICFADKSDYAANVECATTFADKKADSPTQELEKIDTKNAKTIDAVSKLLRIEVEKTVKTLIVESASGGLVALVIRGDHELNQIKAEKQLGIAVPLKMADEAEVKKQLSCGFGSIGVVDLNIDMIVDYSAGAISDFVCGANEDDKHFIGVNWQRDVGTIKTADLRKVVVGDKAPNDGGVLDIKRGIEVGHIFQLGTKYSKAMGVNIISENGKSQHMAMGCYGIGVTRVLAAIIEQKHDDNGIVLPAIIAPFQLVIVPINYNKSTRVRDLANDIYQKCLQENIEVLLDDRKERPGIMFADSELLGISHRIVISDSHVDNSSVEYKARNEAEKITISIDNIISFIKERLAK